jgi:PAS domain S-box-containing protein
LSVSSERERKKKKERGKRKMDDVTIAAAQKRTENVPTYLKMIADEAADGVAIIDLNGTVRFTNAAWAIIHGYDSPQELIGKPICTFHTEEQMITDVMPFIDETFRRGRLAGPTEHARKDGTAFPTKTKMLTIRDESGKAVGLIVFAIDVTQHRQAEVTLATTREQLEQQATRCEQAETKLRQYSAQVEHCVKELAAKLAVPIEQVEPVMADADNDEEPASQSDGPMDDSVGPLFDTERIKSIADLARRLA